MGLSCVVMANVGTYAQIGIAASWIVTTCRILQGLSSMGEIVGAGIYITETVKPPLRYPLVASVVVASSLGGAAALGLAALVTSYGFNWRMAFWVGASVAMIGMIARTTLREAPDYVKAQKKVKKSLSRVNKGISILKDDDILHKKVDKKVLISYFIMESTSPIYFYLNYIYCGDILKNLFYFTSEQVIHHNLILGLVNLAKTVIFVLCCFKIHPLKLIKFRLWAFVPFSILVPYLLDIATNPTQILIIQIMSIILTCGSFPAHSVIYIHFPILKRFFASTLTFATAKAVMYLISSFGMMYITQYFGNLGLLFLTLPLTIGYIIARNYFEKLEIINGSYY